MDNKRSGLLSFDHLERPPSTSPLGNIVMIYNGSVGYINHSKNERVKQLTTIFGLLLEVFKDLENVTTDFGTFTTNSTDDAMSAFKVKT